MRPVPAEPWLGSVPPSHRVAHTRRWPLLQSITITGFQTAFVFSWTCWGPQNCTTASHQHQGRCPIHLGHAAKEETATAVRFSISSLLLQDCPCAPHCHTGSSRDCQLRDITWPQIKSKSTARKCSSSFCFLLQIPLTWFEKIMSSPLRSALPS